MNLSDFFGHENFYMTIDNTCVKHYFCRTTNGELFEEDGTLFYRCNDLIKSIRLAEDVGEWIYIDDSTIMCEYAFDDSSLFRIIDIQGERVGSGIVTRDKELLYKREQHVILEDRYRNKKIVYNLPNVDTAVFFEDCIFSIPTGHPYSNIIYNRYCNSYGEPMDYMTDSDFSRSVLREIEYSFMDKKKLSLVLSDEEDNYVVERICLRSLRGYSDDMRHISYRLVNGIIEACELAVLDNRLSVAGYRKVEALMKECGIIEEIEKPLLNIFSLNKSGLICAPNSRFCAFKVVDYLRDLYNTFGSEKFREILYDANSLHDIIAKSIGG